MRYLPLCAAGALTLAATAWSFDAHSFGLPAAHAAHPERAARQAEVADPLLDDIAALILDKDRPAIAAKLRAELEAFAAKCAGGAAMDAREAAELEAALVMVAETIGSGYTGAWEPVLSGLELPESAHGLRARIGWLLGDTRSLQPLTQWQFAGPFDNERGRGMKRATPAEKDPSLQPFRGKGASSKVWWRVAPEPGPRAVMHLGRLVYPDQQACVVARTWVRSRDAIGAVLMVGAAEELRVWVNGQPVYEALGRHGFGFDGHTVAVALRAGWNEVAVKVGAQDGSPALVARLVNDETGEPLGLVSTAELPSGEEERPLADPGQRLRVTSRVLAPGTGIAALRDAEDASGLVAMAWLTAAAESLPRKDRPGHVPAREARQAAPDSPAAHLARLYTMRVAGALDVEEDVNPWLAELRLAIEQHGDRLYLMEQYSDHASGTQGLDERALGFIDRALALRPNSIPGRAARYTLLRSRGASELASLEARELARMGGIEQWPHVAFDAAGALAPGDPLKAQLLERAAAAGFRPATEEMSRRRLLAGGLVEEERAKIQEELRERLAKEPYDLSVRIWAGRRWLASGANALALGVFDEAVSLCPDAPHLNAWRARALAAAGDYGAAIEAIERSLEFDPSNSDDARYLEYLRDRSSAAASGVIATGEGAFHLRFQEPLEDILKRRVHGPKASGDDVPREVLLHRLVIEAGPDGTARRYERMVERVLSPAGVREMDRRGFRAYPGDEEVRVLAASVVHVDGTVERARTGRTGGRGFFGLDLPPMEPGDIVDMEWRRDDLRPSIFGTYIGVDAAFGTDPRLPVREAEVVLLASPGVDLDVHVTGIGAEGVEPVVATLEDGTVQHTWRIADLEPRRRESLEPPPQESRLRVQASTYADWQSFGRWWWNLIREEVSVSPEMKAKVAELVEGKESPSDRLRAIYDFVVTDIRYNAWEFGVHGYQPYSAPVIFSRRFGDCKDKAILLKAMLGEVGIESWPVIIRSEGRRFEEDLEVAMVNHFNHCIAYVPEQEGIQEMFLDGTATSHPLEVLPDADRGAKVVVVRDDGVELKRIPFPEASENEMGDFTMLDMRDPSGAQVRLVQRPKGRWDPAFRSLFGGDDASRDEAVESILSRRFGGLVMDPVAQHGDYEDLGTPVTLTMDARPESMGRPSGSALELPASFSPHNLLASLASETERRTDLLMGMPWSSRREIVYLFPLASEVVALPTSIEEETSLGLYRREVTTERRDEGLRIEIRENFEIRTHRVAAEDYAAFRAFAKTVDRLQKETLKVEVVR